MSQLKSMSTEPIYKDLKPKVEHQETREEYILRVHVPPGFQRHHYGAKVEFDYSRVRVFGELPLENNTIKRFNLAHQVPATCDINRITGKIVDGSIISITMPKKVPSDPVPEPREETHVEASEAQPEPDESENEEKLKTSTEAKPGELDSTEQGTTEEEKPKTTATEAEPGEEDDYEPDGTPPPQQEKVAKEEESDEVGKSGIPDNEEQPKSSTEQNKIDDSTDDGKPDRVSEEAPSPGDKNIEKDGQSTAPGSEEDVKKPLEEEKATDKDRDSEEVTEKQRIEGKERSSSIGRGDYIDKKIETDEKDERMTEALVGRLKGTVTELFRKRFEEEDKRRVIYMGAAVVVVALGVYASYKFRSSLLRK